MACHPLSKTSDTISRDFLYNSADLCSRERSLLCDHYQKCVQSLEQLVLKLSMPSSHRWMMTASRIVNMPLERQSFPSTSRSRVGKFALPIHLRATVPWPPSRVHAPLLVIARVPTQSKHLCEQTRATLSIPTHLADVPLPCPNPKQQPIYPKPPCIQRALVFARKNTSSGNCPSRSDTRERTNRRGAEHFMWRRGSETSMKGGLVAMRLPRLEV